MNGIQIVEKMRQNPKITALVAVIILLFLYNISSDARPVSHDDKKAPYGNVTMNALEVSDQSGTTDDPPSIHIWRLWFRRKLFWDSIHRSLWAYFMRLQACRQAWSIT